MVAVASEIWSVFQMELLFGGVMVVVGLRLWRLYRLVVRPETISFDWVIGRRRRRGRRRRCSLMMLNISDTCRMMMILWRILCVVVGVSYLEPMVI
jgi:hypothetical protein